MGIGASELTLAQLATIGAYSNVIFFNDATDSDLLKTIVGSPRTILINLAQLLNIADGEVQGDAIAIDELTATQIAAGAVDTSELADGAVTGVKLDATPSLFETATTFLQEHDTGAGDILAADASNDRLVIVQAEVTEAFVTTSWEIDVGSTGNSDGLFDDIFAGVAALAVGETVVGVYMLPATEALAVTETSMVGDTAGIIQFSIIPITITHANASIADAVLASSLVKDPGALATGVLRVTGVTADGQNVVIGADTYEIDPIATDAGDDTEGGNWNNVTDPLTVAMPSGTYPNIGVGGGSALVVGALVYIGTEYLRVTGIVTNDVTFERGAGGSTAATHADAQNIFTSAATPAPTNIPVGVQADFAAGVVGPLLAGSINESSVPTEAVSAVSLDAGALIFVVADAVGAVTLALTETHGNGVWDDGNMRRGVAATVRQVYTATVVPDTEEATANKVLIPVPFTPVAVHVMVNTTSTGVTVLWNGDVIINAAADDMPAYIELNNDGAADWSASTTITILAIS